MENVAATFRLRKITAHTINLNCRINATATKIVNTTNTINVTNPKCSGVIYHAIKNIRSGVIHRTCRSDFPIAIFNCNICRINATATFLYCGIVSSSEINKCSGTIYRAIKNIRGGAIPEPVRNRFIAQKGGNK